MTERVTRRAALAGSVALPLAPAVAVAGKERQDATEARIEALLAEYRRRLAWFEAEIAAERLEDDDDTLDRVLPWVEEPDNELAEITPTTLRGLALQIEAHAVRQGDPHPFDGLGAADLSDHARAILGLPAATIDGEGEKPTLRELFTARSALRHFGVDATLDDVVAALTA